MLRDDLLKVILNSDENVDESSSIVPLPIEQKDKEIVEIQMKIINEASSTIDENLLSFAKVIKSVVKQEQTENNSKNEIKEEQTYITDVKEFYRKALEYMLFEDVSLAKEYENINTLINNIIVTVQEKIEQNLLPKYCYIKEDDIKLRVAQIVNEAKNELTNDELENIELMISMENAIDADVYRDVLTSVYVYGKAIDKLFVKDVFKDEFELVSYMAERDILLTEVASTLLETNQPI
jgi:hypothetical protein